jgi:hypothetical protein
MLVAAIAKRTFYTRLLGGLSTAPIMRHSQRENRRIHQGQVDCSTHDCLALLGKEMSIRSACAQKRATRDAYERIQDGVPAKDIVTL